MVHQPLIRKQDEALVIMGCSFFLCQMDFLLIWRAFHQMTTTAKTLLSQRILERPTKNHRSVHTIKSFDIWTTIELFSGRLGHFKDQKFHHNLKHAIPKYAKWCSIQFVHYETIPRIRLFTCLRVEKATEPCQHLLIKKKVAPYIWSATIDAWIVNCRQYRHTPS